GSAERCSSTLRRCRGAASTRLTLALSRKVRGSLIRPRPISTSSSGQKKSSSLHHTCPSRHRLPLPNNLYQIVPRTGDLSTNFISTEPHAIEQVIQCVVHPSPRPPEAQAGTEVRSLDDLED